jgi:hypothetical protein
VTPFPEPLTVPRLIDDDAVDPGTKSGLTAETRKSAEDAKKDFLRKVERFVALAKQVHGEAKDHTLVRGHQLRAGVVVAVRAAGDERRLAAIVV